MIHTEGASLWILDHFCENIFNWTPLKMLLNFSKNFSGNVSTEEKAFIF